MIEVEPDSFLRPAYAYTCEECGRDHFIPIGVVDEELDPMDFVHPEVQKLIEQSLNSEDNIENEIDFFRKCLKTSNFSVLNFLGPEYLPCVTTCPHCGTQYKIKPD